MALLTSSSRWRRAFSRLWALPVIAVVSIVGGESPCGAASAAGCATPDFLGDFPKEAQLNWSENIQGVAHDDGHWFFTNENSLIKLPADFNLDLDPDFANPTADLRRRQLGSNAYQFLNELGINHFGDIDYYGGFIWAALEAPDPLRSFIGVFEPANLNLVGVAEITEVQEGKGGWVAVDPWSGLLYSSRGIVGPDPDKTDGPRPIFRYKIDLTKLHLTTPDVEAAVTYLGEVHLKESNDGDGEADAPLVRPLRNMQGATFTPWGDLVIENGYIEKSSAYDRGGIHIFRPVGASRTATEFRLIEESVNETGLGGFKFAYDDAYDEEPEGIDWWDRSGYASSNGQLHAQMVDNTRFDDGEGFSVDDFYLKHYAVDYSCLPDFDGDGVATSAEVDVHGTDPLNPDTDGDGLSDGAEVTGGTNPRNWDSDGDGVGDKDDGFPTDSTETGDSDGDGIGNNADLDDDNDGLSDANEVKAGTNPVNPDSDGDGLPDGRDVEFIQTAITALPLNALKPSGGGTKTALVVILNDIETLLAQGSTADAIKRLRVLRTHVDGCGTVPAKDDWVTNCSAQLEIRVLVDTLLANLGA